MKEQMKQITIDMLSVGDRVLLFGIPNVEKLISQDFIEALNALPRLLTGATRIPCTPENTKQGDWVMHYTDFELIKVTEIINSRDFSTDNYSTIFFENCFHPLQKELAAHLAKQEPKPLFADAEVGDLVRFSNGQVEEIISVDFNSFEVPMRPIWHVRGIFYKINGESWHASEKLVATALIKKGSAEWAWEQMLKGEYVNYCNDGITYYIKDGVVCCGFGKFNKSRYQTKENWIARRKHRTWHIRKRQNVKGEAQPKAVKHTKDYRDGYSAAKKIWKAKQSPTFDKGYAKGYADALAEMQSIISAKCGKEAVRAT